MAHKEFLEIECKSSGIIRRFSLGSPAEFAVHRINQLLEPGLPLASYIEAVKEGEEPITFGPQTVVVDYGDGWKLQTVVTEGFEGNKDEDEPFKDFPGIVIPWSSHESHQFGKIMLLELENV
ncbi:hypothetical protein ACHQM5_019470 [Ranunculus cassubicifolius]